MISVANPILPGFHPDPCILRVGEVYYIATSTFEWWPGVRIHRSRDLATWELAGYALTRRTQLNLRGVPDSGGVWAPALSHAHGRFWLVYSNVHNLSGPFKDVRNYLVTAERVEGPWSEPVKLNSSGFDPSLFHDEDGRAWLLNQIWKTTPDRTAFAGIALQEYSIADHALIGQPQTIFRGSALGITEGPHLYRKDGYYYLVTAEGGTGWDHAVTVARSRSLTGPYEIAPGNPLLTASHAPNHSLQKTGHASFVTTPERRWYAVHLCSRPVGPKRRCLLGRETALQEIDWPEGEWPRLSAGGKLPSLTVNLPVDSARPYVTLFEDNFDGAELDPQWNTLREPADPSWFSLSTRPGWLALRGRYSLMSTFDQSLVAFRLLHHCCTVSTRLDFAPENFQQRAGLAFYYSTSNFYYLGVTANDEGDREAQLVACDNRQYRQIAAQQMRLPVGAVELSARMNGETLQFFVDQRPIGPLLDATILSDDHPMEGGVGWAFTGPFAALCAQDASDGRAVAAFDWFRYRSD